MKKFKTISMGLVLTMGLMTGLGATQVFADDQKVYKIACDQAYAPFSIQQDDGSYKGIEDVYKRQAVHSRDNCFLYLKEIVKGESYVMLSQEELEALRKAVNFGLENIEKDE